MTSNAPVFPGVSLKNDAFFLKAAAGPLPYTHCYLQETTEVVHGPSCRNAEQEIDVAACADAGVPVVARRGGGGTVVLSPGMVITIVVGQRVKGEAITDIFRRVHRALIASLAPALTGIVLAEQGISDLAVNGRKVLGSSLYLGTKPFLFYYQSSLMVESDLSLISRYLRHPPREPDYRAGRLHSEFCTTLKQEGAAICSREACDILSRIGVIL